MPLNLRADGGKDFVPFIKFNAKSGRFSARFDGYSTEIEILNPRLLFDFSNIKTGWIAFSIAGNPPQTVWDPTPLQEAPRPQWEKVKRGFMVHVVGRDAVPAAGNATLGVRELMSTAAAIIKPIIEMYSQWEQETGNHHGELPIYKCVGATPIAGKHGTNYEPVFKLAGWADRSVVKELNNLPVVSEQPSPPPPSDIGDDWGETALNESQAPPFDDDDIPF